jgi:hypothetical protein
MISKEDMKLLINKVVIPLEVLVASDTTKPINQISPELRNQLNDAVIALRKLAEETDKNFKDSGTLRVASHFNMMIAGYQLDCEANNEKPNSNAIVSSFMGNGASSDLYVEDCIKFFKEIGYWKENSNLNAKEDPKTIL